jgi:hypothetical protein
MRQLLHRITSKQTSLIYNSGLSIRGFDYLRVVKWVKTADTKRTTHLSCINSNSNFFKFKSFIEPKCTYTNIFSNICNMAILGYHEDKIVYKLV